MPIVSNPKGNQSWILIGRTDAEAETPILWPPAAKNWLSWKDPEAGKDWGQEEKGVTEDEMVGRHHRLIGHGFDQTRGDGDRQGGLACWSPWGRKELIRIERLKWTELIISLYSIDTCKSLSFFFFFWMCLVATGILFPQPGMEPGHLAVKSKSY